MSENQSEPKKRGRPAGSRTADLPHCELVKSRCPACGSTDRARYHDSTTRVLRHAGTTQDGRPYNVVVRKRTWCLACGQVRIDVSYENRVRA